HRHEQVRDDAEAAVVEQVLRVAPRVARRVAVEEPARVRVPESFQAFDESLAVAGVRAVWIPLAVGELMVLAMVRDPAHDVALDGELAEDRERVAYGAVGLERAVRKEAVVADGDPDSREDVTDGQDS